MKNRFGEAIYKVNVDAGFTCPNRDGTLGTTGCIYCNNDSFRPASCKPTLTINEQIKNGIEHIKRRYKVNKFLVYFQPYTNTYAPVWELEKLYLEALSFNSVIGLAIGTRPDAIDEEKIKMIARLAENYFILIEYGMQSIYDKSLEFVNRGHNYRVFLEAVEKTRNKNIFIGAHIIVGFPTETKDEMLAMADEISKLPIEFLKIHQLQVIKDTILETIFREKPFKIFGYEEYIEFVTDFLERLSPDVVIQRLFATAPDDILIAPRWGKSRQEILRDIEKRLEEKNSWQGKKWKESSVLLVAGELKKNF